MPKDVIPTTVTTGPLPASRKVHVPGERNPELRVAMREIVLSPESGEPPLRVYDASGPYTDPAALIDIGAGLPALRAGWIAARGDVEAYDGRTVRPEDDGRRPGEAANLFEFPRGDRRPLRARGGTAVTQMAYARAGIVTPEMEYVAIRENLGRQKLAEAAARDGESFGAAIPTMSRRNSCATRWRGAGPSSRPTSTTRNPSRWRSAGTSWSRSTPISATRPSPPRSRRRWRRWCGRSAGAATR